MGRRTSDRKPVESTLRHRLAGLAIALFVVLLVVAARALPGSARLYRALELKTLDLRFRLRPPLPEDPRVVNIDIDDSSLRNLRLNFPLSRTEYARVVGSLRRLGASQVVLDVMFRDATGWSAEPQEGDRLEIAAHDDNLASAIAAAGNVILAWNYSSDRLPAGGPPDLPGRLRDVLLKDFTLDAAEAARRAGAGADIVSESFESLKGRLLKERLVEALRRRPAGAGPLPPEEILKEIVPGYDPERHAEETRRVREALEEAYSIEALDRHSAWPCPKEAASPGAPIREIMPPLRAFNAGTVRDGKPVPGAAGAGFVNVEKDAEDGVLRRLLPLNVLEGRAYPHLAFRAACEALGVTRDRIRVRPRQAVELGRPAGPPVTIPLDAGGQMLVNWAGSPKRPPFAHVPVGALIMLDRANRDVGINTLAAFDKVRGVCAYLSEKFPSVFPARDLEIPGPLQALVEAEGKAGEAPRGDAWARMERHVALRAHADWMMDRIRPWREKAASLLAAAKAQKKVPAEEADAAKAALDEAEAVVRDFVLPYRAREEAILREFGSRIRGAVCIVGAGGSDHDTHATPMDPTFPGPWVISNVVNMMLTERFLREVPEALNLAAIVLCGLLAGFVVSAAGPVSSAAAVLAAEAGWAGCAYVLFASRGRVVDATGPALAMFLAYAFVTAYRQLVEGRGKRQIRQIFGLFVNDQILGELMRDPEAIALGGQKRVVSVFFSDVAGFTALSEKLDPADQIRFMNDYLTAMSGVIMRNGGTINKYIGDGILALFGAPLESATHAADAARAAAGCLEELARLNASLAAAGKPAIRIRIGISTGEVVVGLVGALGKKLEYTAMGDVVNLGARLEAASKAYKTVVLMSEACHERCRDAVRAREIDLFRVPGKSIPVRAYELAGLADGPAFIPEETLAAYAEGLAHYKARRWEAAEAAFRRALAARPEDGPSKIYLERCAAFRREPPAEDWDGVADVTVK